jgi:putative hydrolase of the HAD superfamily
MAIKNIIFDLGGVLLDIDYDKTVEAFRALGIKHPEKAFSKSHQASIFRAYEKGEITSAPFVGHLINTTAQGTTVNDIEKAWCAMLGTMQEDKFKLLQDLSQSYVLFILSNTNEMHQSVFEAHIEAKYGMKKFRNLFKRIHYSHQMGMRKPDTVIFDAVVNTHQIDPKETLFVDDTRVHVEGALKSGLMAVHLSDEKSLSDILKSAGAISS